MGLIFSELGNQITTLVGIICKESQDPKTPLSRAQGFCDVCGGGFIVCLLLCGTLLDPRSLSSQGRAVPGLCARRDELREATWKRGSDEVGFNGCFPRR